MDRINTTLNTALQQSPLGGEPGGPGTLGAPEEVGPGASEGEGQPIAPLAQLVLLSVAADLKHMGMGPTIFDRDRQMANAFIRKLSSYM